MISRSSLSAIHAVAYLARLPREVYADARTIAKEIDAPAVYLGKLLQQLVEAGLLESRRGPHGGFRFAPGSSERTLFDIVDTIEGTEAWEKCLLGWPNCGTDRPCMLHDRWGPIRERYRKMLQATRFSDLARGAVLHIDRE
jgi:Rrf2 family protein